MYIAGVVNKLFSLDAWNKQRQSTAVYCKNLMAHTHSVGKIYEVYFFFRLKQVADIPTTVFYGIKLNFLPLLR
jgi:hypothetical protein